MESLSRKRCGARELLTKEETRTSSFGGRGTPGPLIMQAASSFSEGWRRLIQQIALVLLDQEVPEWLIMVVFSRKVETAIKSGIKPRFGIKSFSTSDTIWGLWFSL